MHVTGERRGGHNKGQFADAASKLISYKWLARPWARIRFH